MHCPRMRHPPATVAHGDRATSYAEPARAVIEELLWFARQAWPDTFLSRLAAEFFPFGPPDPMPPLLGAIFSEWAVLDRRGHGGATLARRYLLHHRTTRDVADVVRELERSCLCAYRVDAVLDGNALQVIDGFRGSKLQIDMPGVGDRRPVGSTLIARAYPCGDAYRVTPPCVGPSISVDPIVETCRQTIASVTKSAAEPNWDFALKHFGPALLWPFSVPPDQWPRVRRRSRARRRP